jgi:hypothetical protein
MARLPCPSSAPQLTTLHRFEVESQIFESVPEGGSRSETSRRCHATPSCLQVQPLCVGPEHQSPEWAWPASTRVGRCASGQSTNRPSGPGPRQQGWAALRAGDVRANATACGRDVLATLKYIFICIHTHTHTHIYIYMCIYVCVCVCVCVCWQRSIMDAEALVMLKA